MLPLGPLAALALGSLRQHWRVTLALLLGSLLLSGALAAVPITHERLRDAALRDSLATAPPGSLELRVTREGVALDRVAYRDAQAALDQTVANALGDAIAGQTRGGTTAALTLASVLGGEGPRRDLIEDTFGPAALRFRSDLEAHVTLLEGSFPEAMPRGVGDPIPVLAASDTARQANLAPGQELVLVPRRSSGLPPIAIVIAGIAEPSDPASPYWGGRPGLLERTASGRVRPVRTRDHLLRRDARPADPRQRRLRGELHGQPGRRADGRGRGHRGARTRTAEAARRPRRRRSREHAPAGDRRRGRRAGLRPPGARFALRADRGGGRPARFRRGPRHWQRGASRCAPGCGCRVRRGHRSPRSSWARPCPRRCSRW